MKIVPNGISGRPAQYKPHEINQEYLANELSLSLLGDFVPLNIKINCHQLMQELEPYKEKWPPYLPRPDRPNNRTGLLLTTLPGKTWYDSPSLAEADVDAKRRVSELEFNQPTEVFHSCKSLQPLFTKFPILGRCFFVNCGIGGYFVPHRDHPAMPRDVFRLAVFVNNCEPYKYDWLIDHEKLIIEMGRVYYINTRKTHRTISWSPDSIHLILNIPMTTENVTTVISSLEHTH
jgi:hypothetical protein